MEEALKVSLVYQLSNIFEIIKKSNASKKDFVNSICALDIIKIAEFHIKIYQKKKTKKAIMKIFLNTS